MTGIKRNNHRRLKQKHKRLKEKEKEGNELKKGRGGRDDKPWETENWELQDEV